MTALTKHPKGSLAELFVLAYPMILSFLSGSLMIFVDRLFLANYSMAAMNAAAAAGIVVIIFQYGSAVITSIAEVYVGKFNGAQKLDRLGQPVWQMLYFSAFCMLIFFLLANFAGPYLLSDYHYEEQGLPYFQYLLYFAWASPALAAVTSFFLGIGKSKIILYVTVLGNLGNILLDYLFIFGLDSWISPMGAKGAALATGLCLALQFFLLFFLFLRSKYRQKYATGDMSFRKDLFLLCLKTGVPNALGHMIEWAAWAVTLHMMAVAGEHYLTVASIGQSIYGLLAFGFEGIQKAVTTLAANCIGAGDFKGLWKVWRSALYFMGLLAIPLFVLTVLYPDPLIMEFLSTESPPSDLALLFPMLKITAAAVLVYYFLDGFTWICAGILTACEDTYFIMWVNAINSWCFAFAPLAFFIFYLRWGPELYFPLICFYGLMNGLIFYLRLLTKPWERVGSSSRSS